MPFSLNDKLREISPYDPVSGDFPVRLDANESYIRPNEELQNKLSAAIAKTRFNRYPDPAAAELCSAFGEYYGVDPCYVTAGNGSDELLYLISGCFTERGDKIMTLSPDFSMYQFYGYLAECEPVVYNKQADFRIRAGEVIQQCNKSGARILFFSNPCNPTSLGLDKETVRLIVQSVEALVVLDEAYMDFYNNQEDGDESLIKEAMQYDNLIVLRTCSKMIGMASLRLGFAVANPIITKAIRSAKSPYNVNGISQAAGTAILKEKNYLDNCKRILIKSRDSLYNRILPVVEDRGWSVFEPKTNFVLMKPDDSVDLFGYLKVNGILVRRIGDYLRITAGSTEEQEKLVYALDKYVAV